MKKKLELLAPVGKMESLYAAVENGANAVYLGGKLFNARKYASNFNDDELIEAVNYAHLRDVKVYVTMNILIDEDEMSQALDYVRFLASIGIDAIIVQDVGLASLVSKLIPEMDLHASTQMTINNLEGAQFLYENGFTRAVLARETPIEEIKYISNSSPIELEVFIHGALCVSYSGQCLMSSMIGGRSGNRGMCAQPCRMPSSLIDQDGVRLEDWQEKHILSPRDLNTLEEIEELVEAGVLSYKIEGRMKRPEYVATVVASYRKALSLGSEGLEEKDFKDIKQIFNRGFTKGLGFGDFAKEFISYDRPDNRGIYLGKVVESNYKQISLYLEEDLEIGDGIEFQLGSGNYKGMRTEKSGFKGETISLKKIGKIEEGSRVFKTSSNSLLEEARTSYENRQITYPIDFKLDIRLGESPRLILDFRDETLEFYGDSPVEKSRKVALNQETIREQLSKLGDTVYRLRNLEINLDDSCFLPLSALNGLRREAIEKLDRLRLASYKKELSSQEDYSELKLRALESKRTSKAIRHKKTISARVASLEILKKLDLEKLDRVYLEFYRDDKIFQALDYIENTNKDLQIYIATENILYSRDMEFLGEFLKAVQHRIDGVSVANLGSLYYIKNNYSLKIHGDLGLNIFNSYSLEFLQEAGLNSANLSIELKNSQIRKISSKASIDLEALVYGYIQVMTTKHCPMSLIKDCRDDSQCRSCKFASGYQLEDRVGARFRMERGYGHTRIYNSVPLMLIDDLKDILDGNLGGIRLDFNFKDQEANRILKLHHAYMASDMDRQEIEEFVRDYRIKNPITKGHYYRGIMD